MAEAKEKTAGTDNPAETQEKKAPAGLILRSIKLEEKRAEEKLQYGFKGGVIAFVDFDGQLYLTPGTRIKIDLLESCGFRNRRPQIEVPYSDGTAKSKRILRKEIDRNEILRSVEENKMPKQEGKVMAGILKANRDGLEALEEEFLKRCALVEEKYYYYVGLAASFHGVLSFTDWDANTWVTPFSEQKKQLLEQKGYTYVEAMIKVPFALDSKENRKWLAAHVPLDEWERTENEVRQARENERMEKARKKIEELGLKDIPPGLLAACSATEEKLPGNVGMAGSHNGVLSFTDPAGVTWVTPATSDKVENLKALGYQFMGSTIKVPHSLKNKEDIAWLQKNIPPQEWEAARKANLSEQRRREEEMAEKRQRALDLKNLPAELIDHAIRTDVQQQNFVGQYFIRNDVLGFVTPDTSVFITPSAPSKVEKLKEANYHAAPTGFTVPHSDGKPEDMEYLRRHLSQAEIDRSRKELDELSSKKQDERIKRILETLKLEKLEKSYLDRCVRTDQHDLELIGHYCSRGGVTTFIYEDSFYWVTPFTPDKERTLREAGYQIPDRLIKVPYGSETKEDKAWLDGHLPKDELERCRKEIEELERNKKEKELESLRERKHLSDKAPQALTERSANSGEYLTDLIGQYILQGEWLAFVDPMGKVWITPQTAEKVELLKKDNYQYASRRFQVPHSSDSPEDTQWRKDNLPSGEMVRSRQENEAADTSKLDHLAQELASRRSLGEIPADFLARCAKGPKAGPQMVGRFLEKNQFIYIVMPDRTTLITPVTPGKQKVLAEAGYHFPEKVEPLPYCTDNAEDLEAVKKFLPEGELELSRKEREELASSKESAKIKTNIEKLGLKEIPEEITKRAFDSGSRDAKNVGRLGIFRGVLAWVGPDERVFITWYTPDKQETLEDCGYKLEGYMPIKVPHATAELKERRWLLEKLPEANEDEKISVDENAEGVK
ncbi:hypothetical protein LLH00_11155 [bacterium]|nr:hypothetical protein [bacterium]